MTDAELDEMERDVRYQYERNEHLTELAPERLLWLVAEVRRLRDAVAGRCVEGGQHDCPALKVAAAVRLAEAVHCSASQADGGAAIAAIAAALAAYRAERGP